MRWRFIPFQRYDPYFKIGLNKAALESVEDGSDPVVFLAGWETKCINVGRSQTVEDEVDIEEFEKREDIVIVRRQGGGGTTYLTPEGEITWGIVAPEEYFVEDINSIYEYYCTKVAEALAKIGIDAEYEEINDVVTEEGKISGSTLREHQDTLYVGGTMLYNVDVEEMFSLLTPDKDKKKDKQIQDYRERVSSISRESEAGFQESKEALRKQLLEGKDYRKTDWSQEEKERARDLDNKYRTEEWIYRE